MSTAARRGGGATRPAAWRRGVRTSRYWPGLDGLRALAIVAVVAYHLSPAAVPGGFLGVDLFFVISGYLITTLLADEWRQHGRVDLLRFWGRRVRRLYPAVLTLLAVLVPVTAIWDPQALASSRVTIVAALVYLTNWWFIFHRVSYFASFGPPPLLVHLWSLAIEEQYYLIWPPVLVALLVRWRRPTRVGALAAAGAVVSATLMAVLYHGAGSLDRVYYGSDTHAEGLLLGSALGLCVPPSRFSTTIGARARLILDRAGAAALAGLVVLMLVLGQADAFTWRGGIVLAVLLAGVAVVVAAHPATVTSRVLSSPLLRWLGTRSYSIYVWHWPIIVLTDRGGALPLSGATALVVRLLAIAAVSEASYRFVEQPWRTGAAQRALRAALRRSPRARWATASSVGAGFAALAVVVAVVAAPPLPEDTKLTATRAAAVRLTSPAPSWGTVHPVGAGELSPPAAGARPATAARRKILAIGDSVMLAASADLSAAFGPAITVDAVVGRQVGAGLVRLAEYRAAGRLAGLRALVIGLGSNGPFTPADFAVLRQLAAGVPLVVLVNVRVPDPWQAESDRTIDAAAHLPGFAVVNWYATSADQSLLYPDGVHPDPAGQAVYADLVEEAVRTGSSAGPRT